MIVVLKGFFLKFDIGLSKYSNFEWRQFQSISAKFSDWGLLCLPPKINRITPSCHSLMPQTIHNSYLKCYLRLSGRELVEAEMAPGASVSFTISTMISSLVRGIDEGPSIR